MCSGLGGCVEWCGQYAVRPEYVMLIRGVVRRDGHDMDCNVST